MKQNKTYQLILCGLFAALIAVGSWITIPLPFTPVPVNLAVLFVLLAGLLLKPKAACVSVLVYLALGAIGAPVFNGGTGGLSILSGPTGGYLVGYFICVLTLSLLVNSSSRETFASVKLIGSMVISIALLYAFGTMWFMKLTNTALVPSLMACVVPFLPGDGLKIAAAYIVSIKARKTFKSQGLL